MPRALKPLVAIVGLLGGLSLVWHVAMVAFSVKTYFMPMPLATWLTLVERRVLLWDSLTYTLAEAGAGLLLSLGVAVLIAAVCVSSHTILRAAMPFAIAMRSIPIVAIAPLITIIVGRGFLSGVTVVMVSTFFTLFVNALKGLELIRQNILELAHVYGATASQTFLMMRLPFAMPHLFAGLRAAAPAAVLSAMLSEWLTGSAGLGYLILDSAATRELEQLWAAIIVSTVLGMLIFWLTAELEAWFLRRTT